MRHQSNYSITWNKISMKNIKLWGRNINKTTFQHTDFLEKWSMEIWWRLHWYYKYPLQECPCQDTLPSLYGRFWVTAVKSIVGFSFISEVTSFISSQERDLNQTHLLFERSVHCDISQGSETHINKYVTLLSYWTHIFHAHVCARVKMSQRWSDHNRKKIWERRGHVQRGKHLTQQHIQSVCVCVHVLWTAWRVFVPGRNSRTKGRGVIVSWYFSSD